LKKYNAKTVLDCGCGTGTHAIFLAKRGYNVSAFDYSREQVNLARKKARENCVKIDFYVGDIRNFSFGKYDAVEYIRDGITPPKSGLGRGSIGYEHNVLVKKNNQEFIDLLNDSMEVAKTQSRDPIFNEMVSSFVLK